MEIWKAKISYVSESHSYVAEHLGLAGEGVDSDPLFHDAPKNGTVLKALGKAILDTHSTANSGDEGAKADFEVALEIGKAAMHEVSVYSNFKCAGNKDLYIKIKVPYYKVKNSGKSSSSFSLTNGPLSGQLLITVPTSRKISSFIAMYTTDPNALISNYLLAGGSSNCRFELNNLPVGAKIYVIWAAIDANGIGGFSVPYPIIVT